MTIKEDWGHSNNVVAVDLCHLAAVKRLAMFHHEPIHDDDTIRQIHQETLRYEELMRQGSKLEVLCAYDRLETRLSCGRREKYLPSMVGFVYVWFGFENYLGNVG